ncbi:hypothetical protein [Virgibacillus siamensis]|uniref:hypothetical protein n=1 Tax=Virgibacillus siamensis TaxID=480071 RepID=UPI0009860C57|nr:hypothetical protein [Virgibacillus siamensis]
MATYTTNYNLYKPNANDSAIQVDTSLTDNFVAIDTEIKNRQNEISSNNTDISNLQTDVGTLTNLSTVDKSNLVSAVNEVNGKFIESNKGAFVASGDGAAVSFNIPHGLSAAPSFYVSQEGSADTGTAEISHVTADATNLIVTFKAAPAAGTSNVTIVWKAEI